MSYDAFLEDLEAEIHTLKQNRTAYFCSGIALGFFLWGIIQYLLYFGGML